MMCFGVILPIIVAFFAVFGLYSLFVLVEETWFASDNISICLTIDTADAVQNFECFLREAKRRSLSRQGQIIVLVRREFVSEAMLDKFRRRHIYYYVVDMENKAE